MPIDPSTLVPPTTLWVGYRGAIASLYRQSSHPKPLLVTRMPHRVGMGHACPTTILTRSPTPIALVTRPYVHTIPPRHHEACQSWSWFGFQFAVWFQATLLVICTSSPLSRLPWHQWHQWLGFEAKVYEVVFTMEYTLAHRSPCFQQCTASQPESHRLRKTVQQGLPASRWRQ
jgi:hypothetical protein